MKKKNLVQVVIGGKVLSMGGSEDELHIQKVASCVNRKLQELEPTEGYRALPVDLKPMLVELNLAEDLIRAQETIEMLKSDIQMMENELSEVKQALAETQIELEELESSAVQMSFSDIGWMSNQTVNEPRNPIQEQPVDEPKNPKPEQMVDKPKNPKPEETVDEPKNPKPEQPVDESRDSKPEQPADEPRDSKPEQLTGKPQVQNRMNNHRPAYSRMGNVVRQTNANPGNR